MGKDLILQRTDIRPQEDTQLALLAAPPDDAVLRDRMGQELWEGLILVFERRLSERDLALWKNPPSNISTFPEHLRILGLFDDYILDQFAEWGWRLLMSSGALQRLAEWEKHSPHLLRRLGEELELKSKIFRGEKQARLPEGIEEFADGAIEELGRLLRLQRDEFGQRATARCERIAEWMKSEVEARQSEFRYLFFHRAQLHAFVRNLPRRNPTMARRVERGDLRAQGFFYQWYATFTNRSPKDVENLISRRRRRS
jgi:hypothetical protein